MVNTRSGDQTLLGEGSSDSQWRPTQTNTTQELHAIVQAYLSGLHRQTTTVIWPKYSGKLAEDPEAFFVALAAAFENEHIPPEQQVPRALQQLEGEAARQLAQYEGLQMSWAEFQDVIRLKFAAPERRHRQIRQVLEEEQRPDEDVAAFIFRKRQEARRLLPTLSDKELACAVHDLLKPQVRHHLPPVVDSLEELCTRATAVEEALRRPTARPATATTRPAGARQVTAPAPAPTAAAAPSRPAPQDPRCRFCPERHWHRDCPVRRAQLTTVPDQGNEEPAGVPEL